MLPLPGLGALLLLLGHCDGRRPRPVPPPVTATARRLFAAALCFGTLHNFARLLLSCAPHLLQLGWATAAAAVALA